MEDGSERETRRKLAVGSGQGRVYHGFSKVDGTFRHEVGKMHASGEIEASHAAIHSLVTLFEEAAMRKTFRDVKELDGVLVERLAIEARDEVVEKIGVEPVREFDDADEMARGGQRVDRKQVDGGSVVRESKRGQDGDGIGLKAKRSRIVARPFALVSKDSERQGEDGVVDADDFAARDLDAQMGNAVHFLWVEEPFGLAASRKVLDIQEPWQFHCKKKMSALPKTMSQVIAVLKKGCPACIDTKPALRRAQQIAPIPIDEIDADDDASMVRKLDVQAFPDVIYRSSNGTIQHMPWDGVPSSTDIADFVDAAHAGKTFKASKNDCPDCQASDKREWGPALWFVIHMVALMYPSRPTPKERREMISFFVGLKDVLPCSECKKHYAAGLEKTDPRVFDSRDSLFEWTVNFHQSVSDRTGSTYPRRSVAYWKRYYKNLARMGASLKGSS